MVKSHTIVLIASCLCAGGTAFAFTPVAKASTRPWTTQQQPFSLSVVTLPGDSISDSSDAVGSSTPFDISLPSFRSDELVILDGSQSSIDGETKSVSDPGLGMTESHCLFEGISLENPSLGFARLLVLVASAVYGTNFAVVKLLDEQVPFAISATLRFGFAAAVVSTMVVSGESKPQRSTSAKDIEERVPATVAGMEIGAWYCLAYLCQSVGLQTADASKSAFFNALAVIAVPLLDSLFRGKQMGFKGMSSVALAILGVGLLQLGPSIFAGTPVSFAPGDAFCLAQAALFGVGYWRLEHVSSDFPTQAGRITAGQLIGVALGSTVFCGLTADIPTLQQVQAWMSNSFVVGGLVWTALVSTALALFLETVALKAVSAAELTVLMTSVSLFGSAFAYVAMGEVMSPVGMAGGLLILAGCVFSSFGGQDSGTIGAEDNDAAALRLQSSPLVSEPDYYDDNTGILASQAVLSSPTYSNATLVYQ